MTEDESRTRDILIAALLSGAQLEVAVPTSGRRGLLSVTEVVPGGPGAMSFEWIDGGTDDTDIKEVKEICEDLLEGMGVVNRSPAILASREELHAEIRKALGGGKG